MSATKLLLAAAITSVSLAANAADLPVRTQPLAPAPMAMSWTGFYVGGLTGYNFFTNTAGAAKPNGALLGLRAGYDHQISPDFVLGVFVDGELDFGKKSIAGSVGGVPYTASIKHRYTVAVDLKAGYVLNAQTMVYAFGGYTHSEIKASATVASISASESYTGNGWNAGLGAEYRFTKEWSGIAEYRFNKVKKDSTTVNVSQIKLGVAYRF
jgi:outer membrane immunogenic protein